ncbi:hypothetical protein TNCV_4804671 [Trichonephila clavipes]|nr:hypothetical protein TNCV_4804671 [Trichonephila clavipes]
MQLINNYAQDQEDDDLDEGSDQTNAGSWSAVVRLKKPASIKILHFTRELLQGFLATEHQNIARGCISTFFDCGTESPACCIFLEVDCTRVFPKPQSLRLLLGLTEIAFVQDAGGCSGGSRVTDPRRFS